MRKVIEEVLESWSAEGMEHRLWDWCWAGAVRDTGGRHLSSQIGVRVW